MINNDYKIDVTYYSGRSDSLAKPLWRRKSSMGVEFGDYVSLLLACYLIALSTTDYCLA